jgi:stage II sporulation protein E
MANRSKDYELLARALDESFKAGDEMLSLNAKQREELEKLLTELGLGDASAKIFGTKKRHIITAGLDAGGKISTSKELRDAIEKKLSAKISAGDFYKKDDFILSEFDELEKFECTLGTSSEIKTGERIGGDSTVSFKDSEGRFYVLLCDGEGSGEEANEVSILTCDYLSRILKSSVSKATAISAINHILKNRDNEKGVTVDLFELDLYTGEGVFYKCGAVSSYIKRSDSIFKVRSQSAPIGLMSSIDAESIRVDVRAGDTVVLVSDGVLSENEDNTWFLEILNREKVGDVKEYADMILNHAKKRNDCADDMSVAVIKISA